MDPLAGPFARPRPGPRTGLRTGPRTGLRTGLRTGPRTGLRTGPCTGPCTGALIGRPVGSLVGSLVGVIVVLGVAVAGCGSNPPVPPPSQPPSQPPSSVRPSVSPPAKPIAPRRRDRPREEVPHAASGRYAVVHGGAPARPGRGNVVRYLVEVERGLPFDPAVFAAEVHRTLNDVRGWARFQRVDHGPVRVRVALSSPHMTIRQCRPLRTGGELSCWNGTRSIINARRWAQGVPQYGGDLAAYRRYLISHEVGHGLGHHHRACPGPGRLAPVMAQQTKSLGRCRPNPWPFPHRAAPHDPGALPAKQP